MKALVTGGGGFLGRYIVEQLVARGDQVRTFSRQQYQCLSELGVEQITGDIQDSRKVIGAGEGVDAVFHTAAIAGIWGPWRTFYQVNFVGTENVLASCRKHSIPKLVFSSSPSVIFDGSNQDGLDETTPYPKKWLCYYQQTKAMAEQIVLEANDETLTTCALRPHLIWGPRDQHLIPRLIDRAMAGKLRIVGDGKNLVDNIYVENAAEAHLQACDALLQNSKLGGQAYFISQGLPVNCWDWINEILTGCGQSPQTKRISFGFAWRVGWLMEWAYRLTGRKSEPRMTRFLAAQLAKNHYYNIDKARNDFGFEPRIGHDEAMRRTLSRFPVRD